MTLLIREIEDPKAWRQAAKAILNLDISILPPLEILECFIPNVRDNGGLSVYEVEDESEAEIVAAALAFMKKDLESGQFIFVCAELSSVQGAFEIKSTTGNTKHSVVNTKHREISIKSIEDLKVVSAIFTHLDPFVFEGKSIVKAACVEAASNRFEYLTIHKTDQPQKWGAQNLSRIVARQAVRVAGNPNYQG